MADSAIGPARNLLHINIFWVKSAKSTAGSVDAKGRKGSVCLYAHTCVCLCISRYMAQIWKSSLWKLRGFPQPSCYSQKWENSGMTGWLCLLRVWISSWPNPLRPVGLCPRTRCFQRANPSIRGDLIFTSLSINNYEILWCYWEKKTLKNLKFKWTFWQWILVQGKIGSQLRYGRQLRIVWTWFSYMQL